MLCWCMTVVVFGTCFLVYMMCWVPRTCFIDQVYNLIHVHVHSRARFDKLYSMCSLSKNKVNWTTHFCCLIRYFL